MKKLLVAVSALFLFTMQSGAQSTKASTANPTALKASFERGKILYATSCLACHQADGSGVPNLNPPLINTSWVLGPKTKLIEILLKGSNGQVEIDGETFHNTMPAQTHLTDVQIADVLTFVRSSFGNKASFVTPAEVKAVRAKTN